ncbi:methylesterase 3-like [Herrania umbratica]|uniref:Methylesterase 3-like n=1 Tax=Herrania umbratica TaxID=108875 RepID=A0A6J1AHL5_9ROSI|nr:methylesterase 3-like [Herrania umbratica]
MASLPLEEKVIVGHCLGGLAISQAMERFPEKISVAVFVATIALALATMLLRPNRLFSVDVKSRELVLTSEKYGTVNRVFMAAEYDLIYEEGVQRWMIQQNQPDQVEEIKGSDHMVLMSKPVELFNLLLSIAMKYKPEEGQEHFAA